MGEEESLFWTQGDVTCELLFGEEGLTFVGECELDWEDTSFVLNDDGEITGITGPGGDVFPVDMGAEPEDSKEFTGVADQVESTEPEGK
jgi:hypothetical protein